METKERIEEAIAIIIFQADGNKDDWRFVPSEQKDYCRKVARKVLSIEFHDVKLAVVYKDSEGRLPENFYEGCDEERDLIRKADWGQAQQDMLAQGWVKEVKE